MLIDLQPISCKIKLHCTGQKETEIELTTKKYGHSRVLLTRTINIPEIILVLKGFLVGL